MTTVTLAVTASNSDATITFSPTDADTSVDGHQINSIPQGVRTVTITVARGSDTEIYTIEIYTIELASHEQPAMESDQAVRAASSRRPYRVLRVNFSPIAVQLVHGQGSVFRRVLVAVERGVYRSYVHSSSTNIPDPAEFPPQAPKSTEFRTSQTRWQSIWEQFDEAL